MMRTGAEESLVEVSRTNGSDCVMGRLQRCFPDRAQVWIDFDGTITERDVLDELIKKFAVDLSWHEVERLWSTGKIGSYECLRREFDLIRIGEAELEKFLRTIPVDGGVWGLFEMLEGSGVPFAILSDGIESFIRKILSREKPITATIRSNRVEQAGNRLSLVCPHRVEACESRAAHCKCASAKALQTESRVSIYIGDGRSDLCPARKAEVVFAKGALARLLTAEGKPFIAFETLADVTAVLKGAMTKSLVGAGSVR